MCTKDLFSGPRVKVIAELAMPLGLFVSSQGSLHFGLWSVVFSI